MLRYHRSDVPGSVGYLLYPIEAIHPHARLGALYAICAAAQGRFREADQYLFETTEWMDSAAATAVARGIGVGSVKAFLGCLSSPSAVAKLDEQRELATRLGIRVTPSLVTRRKRTLELNSSHSLYHGRSAFGPLMAMTS
jgi:protein-disulfide isomerase